MRIEALLSFTRIYEKIWKTEAQAKILHNHFWNQTIVADSVHGDWQIKLRTLHSTLLVVKGEGSALRGNKSCEVCRSGYLQTSWSANLSDKSNFHLRQHSPPTDFATINFGTIRVQRPFLQPTPDSRQVPWSAKTSAPQPHARYQEISGLPRKMICGTIQFNQASRQG